MVSGARVSLFFVQICVSSGFDDGNENPVSCVDEGITGGEG